MEDFQVFGLAQIFDVQQFFFLHPTESEIFQSKVIFRVGLQVEFCF